MGGRVLSAATNLIEDLSSRGVEFALTGGKIQFRGARSVITPQHVETLKEHRREVVQFLLSRMDYPRGRTFDGTPKTWTGKIVSLDQWRRLSEWEKHGLNGKHWNGETQSWEMPE
jgi:hypothetical protein